MAIVISGIGRSGTTLIFRVLGNGFVSRFHDVRCVYEPYLWNIPGAEKTAQVQGQPFDVNQVGLFNKYVHCNTPLFLNNRHRLHDSWMNRVFKPADHSSPAAPDNVLVKVIRGAGRLEAMLTRFTNLKVVIITRNVIDTVNSALGLFSLFGDEFHVSDKDRFIDEINQKFNARIDREKIQNEVQWSVLWWHYFTESQFRVMEKYPGRVLLIPYEALKDNKIATLLKIFEFANIDDEHLDQDLVDISAGPSTSKSFLDDMAIDQMNDELNWYFEYINRITYLNINPQEFRQDIIRRFQYRGYTKSSLMEDNLSLTGVQLRLGYNRLLNDAETRKNESKPDIHFNPPYTLSRALVDFGDNNKALAHARESISSSSHENPTLGVVITCFNNASTIAESVFSVLSQSRIPDEIIVADDASTDDSAAIIDHIAQNYKPVSLVRRSENIGVAANRDLAIRELGTDYITTLDGDDLYLPGKLELEYRALAGSSDKVAFSSIGVVSDSGISVQDTSAYHDNTMKNNLVMLTSRSAPVPRDMMFPKRIFIEAGGFNIDMNMYEDWALKMRIISITDDGSWIHSGGIGTIYNRTQPGLSGKPKLFHAYAQLLALAANRNLLREHPAAISGGLRTVNQYLDGDLGSRMHELLDRIQDGCIPLDERLIDSLGTLWKEASFTPDKTTKIKSLEAFLNYES